MGFEYNELRGRIIAKFGTLENFAEILGVSQATLSKKLNNKVAISQKDVSVWAEKLGIPMEEIGSIFFTLKVQSN